MPEMAEAQVLFAQELSRDCGDRLFCETVTTESIDTDEYIYFAERAYLEPTTATGPAADEIISPVILAFDPIEDVRQGQQPGAAGAVALAVGRLRGPSGGRVDVTQEAR